jgi:hypothetical protein
LVCPCEHHRPTTKALLEGKAPRSHGSIHPILPVYFLFPTRDHES